MTSMRHRRKQWEIADDLSSRGLRRVPGEVRYECEVCMQSFSTVVLAEAHVCPGAMHAPGADPGGVEDPTLGDYDLAEALPLLVQLENLQVASLRVRLFALRSYA